MRVTESVLPPQLLPLSNGTLAELQLAVPAYDRTAARVGIIHIGVDGFHRARICGPDLHLYRYLVADTRVSTNFGREFCRVVEDARLKSRTPSPASMCQVTI